MRKELTVYVNTMERGEEFSISSVTKDRKYVIISLGGTVKFTADVEDLEKALATLKEFNAANVQEVVEDTRNSVIISYGEE